MPLSRRQLLRLSGALASLPAGTLIPKPTAFADPAGGQKRTYYVSTSGSDEADGLSPESAWATIQKANSSVPPGASTLLFRSGDTFFGQLIPAHGCVVGAYGTGERPILTNFKLLNRPDSWVEDTPGIWKIDLGSPASHDGYEAISNNIGFLMVDGEVKPALKFRKAELTSHWDFYCEFPEKILFICAPTNPTALASDIKAAPNGRIISCENGSNTISDLHLTGTGGCGIAGTAPDVHIHDCLIDYIGGANLRDGSLRRYGNGIENWVDVKRWLIERNEITQVYDVAWTPQGRAGPYGSWEDVTVRNNHIHDCTQTFEFWSSGNDSAGGFKRILVEGNVCERGGFSVFASVRPDQDVRVHLLTYLWKTPADIMIRNNVFDAVYGAYSYHAFEPEGLVTQDNILRLKAGTKLEYQRPETVEQFHAWQHATGRESGSELVVTS